MPSEPQVKAGPLQVPLTTYFTQRDATILRLLEATTGFSVKQIIRYATRKYIAEKLSEGSITFQSEG